LPGCGGSFTVDAVCRYYASYVAFFSAEVATNGAANSLETYVFAQDANEENIFMLSRFLAGA
jgi:hypothetical protein